MKRTLGFIGLGVMGQAMARNLSRKYPGLLVFDQDVERMAALSRDAVEAAAGLAGLGRRAGGEGKKSQPAVVRLWESLLKIDVLIFSTLAAHREEPELIIMQRVMSYPMCT
jgi:6-phosphogluconate dehydrogenase (decarboxylating)